MKSVLFIILLYFFCINNLFSQKNWQYKPQTAITGNIGLILIPTAEFADDREINISFHSNPKKYHFLPFKHEPIGEKIISASFNFLPFVEFGATIIRPDNIAETNKDSVETRWGIGDRSVKIRFHILNESKYFPSIVIGFHDFVSANFYQSAAYIVSSKSVIINDKMKFNTHLGYGFDVSKSPWTSTRLFSHESSKPENVYLNGIFAGCSFVYKFFSVNTEFDTQKINLGISALLFNHLSLQFSTLDFDQLSAGCSFRFCFGDSLIKKKL